MLFVFVLTPVCCHSTIAVLFMCEIGAPIYFMRKSNSVGSCLLYVLFLHIDTFAWRLLARVDNLCYKFGLGERIHARVEDKGRITLNEEEAKAMTQTKGVHIVMIVASILFSVSMAGDMKPSKVATIQIRRARD